MAVLKVIGIFKFEFTTALSKTLNDLPLTFRFYQRVDFQRCFTLVFISKTLNDLLVRVYASDGCGCVLEVLHIGFSPFKPFHPIASVPFLHCVSSSTSYFKPFRSPRHGCDVVVLCNFLRNQWDPALQTSESVQSLNHQKKNSSQECKGTSISIF